MHFVDWTQEAEEGHPYRSHVFSGIDFSAINCQFTDTAIDDR